MKSRNIIILIVFISIVVFYVSDLFYSQYKKDKSSIYWSKNIKITPKDFEANIDLKSRKIIYWYHELYMNSSVTSDGKMIALFNKQKSWIKDTTDFQYHMKRQKLRFDLFEFYALKYNSIIDTLKNNSYEIKKNIQTEIWSSLKKELKNYDSHSTMKLEYEVNRIKLDSMLRHQ